MHLIGNQLDKRLFLWGLFCVQVFLIGGFLLFGSAVIFPVGQGHADNQTRFVEFVQRSQPDGSHHKESGEIRMETIGRYEHEFVGTQNCFKARYCVGCLLKFLIKTIILQDGLARRFNTTDPTTNQKCICKTDYHGRDCGQPEVLWRAFMTAKMPLKLSAISRRNPHSIFYIIQSGLGSAASLETLEVQIMELMHVVDLFVLCDQKSSDDTIKNEILEQQTRTGTLKPFRYKLLILKGNCSFRSMYNGLQSTLKKHNKRLRTDDVLLVSGQDEILNWRAVKYLKWYDHWPQPTQFRLKYLVYGFYWQHPQSTRLGSAACQISVLDEVYKSDPRKILSATKPGMIIGDLNHIGGWFCQYCYHPLNVVDKLIAEKSEHILNHQRRRGQTQLDGSYIESLIANGLFVDGQLGLTRLHRFADKYYAPDYVRNSSWKYENVLSNVYATYDDDYAN